MGKSLVAFLFIIYIGGQDHLTLADWKNGGHGVLCEGRIRRLTPRECLRLQGWADDRIDTVLAIQSDNQAYKQAGNGVTVHVVEAIGRRIAKMDAELRGEALAP